MNDLEVDRYFGIFLFIIFLESKDGLYFFFFRYWICFFFGNFNLWLFSKGVMGNLIFSLVKLV